MSQEKSSYLRTPVEGARINVVMGGVPNCSPAPDEEFTFPFARAVDLTRQYGKSQLLVMTPYGEEMQPPLKELIQEFLESLQVEGEELSVECSDRLHGHFVVTLFRKIL